MSDNSENENELYKKRNWPTGTPVPDPGVGQFWRDKNYHNKPPITKESARASRSRQDNSNIDLSNAPSGENQTDEPLTGHPTGGQITLEENFKVLIGFIFENGVGLEDGMSISEASRRLSLPRDTISTAIESIKQGIFGLSIPLKVDHEEFMDGVEALSQSMIRMKMRLAQLSLREVDRRLLEEPEAIPFKGLFEAPKALSQAIENYQKYHTMITEASQARNSDENDETKKVIQIKRIFSDAEVRNQKIQED